MESAKELSMSQELRGIGWSNSARGGRVKYGEVIVFCNSRNLCDAIRSIADTAFLKDGNMKVDVYKRPEQEGLYSYLAVPEGRPIPNEATNVDWETADHNIDLDENNDSVLGLDPRDALDQIRDKGYAISSIQNKVRIGPGV
jgi:hypothetical protein